MAPGGGGTAQMTGIDTNVLVRYLVDDDQEQADRVHRFLARCRRASEPVYISSIVLCETLWVLRSAFASSKLQIVEVLERLLSSDVFQIEQEDSVRAALDLFRTAKGEFVDCLIGQLNLAKGCRATVTFDRDLRSISGFSAL